MTLAARILLALLLIGNIIGALMQHGRITPRRTYDAKPAIAVTVLVGILAVLS